MGDPLSWSYWNSFGLLVFVEGGKPENLEKNAWNKARTNNKLNPHTPVWHWAGIEAGPHLW